MGNLMTRGLHMLQGQGKKEPQRISIQKKKVLTVPMIFYPRSSVLCDWRMCVVLATAYLCARLAVGTVPCESVITRQQWSLEVIFSSPGPQSIRNE